MKSISYCLRQCLVFSALVLVPVLAQAQNEEPASDYDPASAPATEYSSDNSGSGSSAPAADGSLAVEEDLTGASSGNTNSSSWWQLWLCYYGYCNHSYHQGGGNNVPLDGGLSLLLAAGAGLGVKKLRDYRKQKNTDEAIS